MPFNRCWLRLTNGWTVSMSKGPDTPPAVCSVAAWPTSQDSLMEDVVHHYDTINFFDFGRSGSDKPRTDCQCWSFSDVREALQAVSAAAPPKEG